MQSEQNQPLTLVARTRHLLWFVLAAALVARVAAMFIIPLADSSEARYGEIARKMAETGNWITPQIDYGVPFWAKPPLSTWLSALCIKLFGVNEFSARLPSLALSIAVLALVWHWLAQRRGRDQALATIALLATTALFAASAGAVMTDPSLMLCSTLTMVSFWNAIHREGRHWGYLFFVGLGIGLLAKGPLIGVLTFLPVLTWLFARREWRLAWQCLPWISGTLLMLAIAVPWYVLAEQKTPGFLQYFIVGEHINRFLHAGWHGDKYGNAHAAPIGTIWIYWFYAAFPFSAFALFWIVKHRRRLLAVVSDRASLLTGDGWIIYLLLWVVMDLAFFTAAGNVIWSYPLPGLPAFACVVVELHRVSRSSATAWQPRRFLAACCLTPLATAALIALYLSGSSAVKASQRSLVETWQAQRSDANSRLVYYRKNYPSAHFYAHGKVQSTENAGELDALLSNDSGDFIAVKNRDLPALSSAVRERFQPLHRFEDLTLLREIAPNGPHLSAD